MVPKKIVAQSPIFLSGGSTFLSIYILEGLEPTRTSSNWGLLVDPPGGAGDLKEEETAIECGI